MFNEWTKNLYGLYIIDNRSNFIKSLSSAKIIYS